MSEVKPVLYLGTKLVPYEERTFRSADLRDAMGYTHDHKQFYSEEQVQKLLAENERLRAEVAMLTQAVEQGHATIKIGHQLHDALANEMREVGVMVESDPIRVVNLRAERLAEALRKVGELLCEVECASAADALAVERCHDLIRAALDQEGGNG